ncbi:hypothetical protein [Thalassiella azotivora]
MVMLGIAVLVGLVVGVRRLLRGRDDVMAYHHLHERPRGTRHGGDSG